MRRLGAEIKVRDEQRPGELVATRPLTHWTHTCGFGLLPHLFFRHTQQTTQNADRIDVRDSNRLHGWVCPGRKAAVWSSNRPLTRWARSRSLHLSTATRPRHPTRVSVKPRKAVDLALHVLSCATFLCDQRGRRVVSPPSEDSFQRCCRKKPPAEEIALYKRRTACKQLRLLGSSGVLPRAAA